MCDFDKRYVLNVYTKKSFSTSPFLYKKIKLVFNL